MRAECLMGVWSGADRPLTGVRGDREEWAVTKESAE